MPRVETQRNSSAREGGGGEKEEKNPKQQKVKKNTYFIGAVSRKNCQCSGHLVS